MQNNRPCVLTDERSRQMPAAFLSADKPRGGTNAVPYFFRRRRNKTSAARKMARGGANGEFINNERLFAATNVAYSVASTP